MLIRSFKSLAPGRCGRDFEHEISEHMLLTEFMTCGIALGRIPQNKTLRQTSKAVNQQWIIMKQTSTKAARG